MCKALILMVLPVALVGAGSTARAQVGAIGSQEEVSIKDATIALQIAVGLLPVTADALARYDVAPAPGTGLRVVGDGKVDIADAVRILRAVVGLLPASWLYPPEQTQLFTLNGGGFSAPGTVSVIDLAKLRAGQIQEATILRAFASGSVPNNMQIVGDEGYLVNSTSHTLEFVDLKTFADVGPALFLGTDAQPAPKPMQVAIVGNTGYVSLLYADAVAAVDLIGRKVIGRIPVGTAPQGIASSGGQVFVANTGFTWNAAASHAEYKAGSVSVIDASMNAVIGELDVPTNPTFVDVDPEGRLHVSSSGDYVNDPGAVTVFRLVPGQLPQLIGQIPIGGTPGALAFSPNGYDYVAGALGVMEYDPETLSIRRGPGNPIALKEGPVDLAADSRGRLYAALFSKNEVAVVDTRTDTVVQEVPVGSGPEALAIR